jgi:hypothetical protein
MAKWSDEMTVKITYWNDYPISRIIVVAAAIKYLLEGLL